MEKKPLTRLENTAAEALARQVFLAAANLRSHLFLVVCGLLSTPASFIESRRDLETGLY